ncbi:MAG: ferrochelatase [Pyrinomonadaceae bacterium MAG19_C2-C3]|nr:ferrochelatase [Pyrinomonadaceae bacterium MAG19_C2-C3]
MTQNYDALLVLSFGGPEGMADVMPFLENVLRGRNVPRERMIEVSHHYEMFGGVSPINNQNRLLINRVREVMPRHNIHLPIYWGNRNWHPMLADTLEQMKADGIKRAITFVTSAYSSYSGCRQYREDLAKAQEAVGEGAPQFDKLRVYYNHPGFIEANADCLRAALHEIPPERRAETRIAFTAHSIPVSMATNCTYEAQLSETCRLVAEAVNHPHWQLVYQSRSGQANQAWLEPDICDYLHTLRRKAVTDVVIAPVGFISDHIEVLFDLDTEARQVSQEINLNMIRAATVGTHPAFIDMICELITERMNDNAVRRFIGTRGANHDVCPVNCCLPAVRPNLNTEARPASNASGD